MPKVNRQASITLAHGSGGKAMHDLINDLFVTHFDNAHLSDLEDQARFELSDLTALGDRLAMTTDSFVVDPLFFPGGDIGKLAICGTVNDLAVSGAKPLYLTCGLIIEEGLSIATLEQVILSMKSAADEAGVAIVTGDTKVVHKGAADKLFINTAGVGVIPEMAQIHANNVQPGDVIICNGYIGDHGAAIVDARGELALESTVETDCAPLNHLISAMLEVCPDIHAMRDATRGGVATVLNEFANSSGCKIVLDETTLKIRDEVRGICEILGLDPLYLANEGKLIAAVPADKAEKLIQTMQQHPLGQSAAIIGQVHASDKSQLLLQTAFGGERLVDILVGEQLPRIC